MIETGVEFAILLFGISEIMNLRIIFATKLPGMILRNDIITIYKWTVKLSVRWTTSLYFLHVTLLTLETYRSILYSYK